MWLRIYAANESGPKVAVATYSLRKFSRPEAIVILKQLGVSYLSVKEFHLPYKESTEALRAGLKEFDTAELKIMSGGVVVTSREDDRSLRRICCKCAPAVLVG